MCLYPKLILNRKYLPNKKNKGRPPKLPDERVKYVAIGCQKCMECRKQRANEWRVRLMEEIRNTTQGWNFVTFTYSDEKYEELAQEVLNEDPEVNGYDLDNKIAELSITRWRELWRKHTGKAPRRWLITELGQEKTERLHIHGIVHSKDKSLIQKIWKYGKADAGEYVNEATINYIVKYVMKTDLKHPNYIPIIRPSYGLGKGYIKRPDAQNNKYQGEKTKEYYVTRQGLKMAMPTYLRNKIYTEEEREKLWLHLLDREERFVNGQRVSLKNGIEEYYNVLQIARQLNKQLKYGDDSKDWDKIKYEKYRRELKRKQRIEKLNEPPMPRTKPKYDKEDMDIILNLDRIAINRLREHGATFDDNKGDRIQITEELKNEIQVYRGEMDIETREIQISMW